MVALVADMKKSLKPQCLCGISALPNIGNKSFLMVATGNKELENETRRTERIL